MSYSKTEVIELAAQVLGKELDPVKPIPLPVLEALGLYREYTHYVEVK